MSTQKQDLVLYDDHSLLSEKILESGNHVLHTITHSEGTKPAWLINSLVETCLVGTANLVNRELISTPKSRALVTYVSFLESEDFIAKNCRKNGLDLEKTSDFHFVDCFKNLFSKTIVHPRDAETEIEKLFSETCLKIQASSHNSKVVIVQSPELLLAATQISSNCLIHHLQKLNQVCNILYVVCDADNALINFDSSNPADPVFRITDFYVKLHHKSSLNVNLLPLATGKARDITGSLTVSNGALPPHESLSVLQKEYAFHISREASVNIFYK